jgi:hypothetical protein
MFATTANTYDYRWYQEGLYFAFLQRQQESIYDPYYSVREDIYKTPANSDSNAILVRYTLSLSAPASETTDLGIARELGMGVVHYVKSKLLEDKDLNLSRWHYNKFLYYCNVYNRNVKGAPPTIAMAALPPGAVR